MKKNVLLLVVVCFSLACFEELPEHKSNSEKSTFEEVLVQEVIQTDNYTYLNVTSKRGEKWLALPKINAKPGDIFYHGEGMPMKNFKSSQLNRVFPSVLFLEKLYNSPDEVSSKKNESKGSDLKVKREEIDIKSLEGGLTIAELFKKKKEFEGQKVKISGKVVKFNSGIMGANWIHLQDGTEFNGEYDLVITSNKFCRIGDMVTVEGVVVLNKDFGHGYFYKILIEETRAKISQNN